jgi:Ca2+-binding EF-hand superfamily protein
MNHRLLIFSSSSQDYIQTLSILVRGSIKEKLQWIFHFYDISDDGKLTKQVEKNYFDYL